MSPSAKRISPPTLQDFVVNVRLFGYVEVENNRGRFTEEGFEHPLSMILLKYLLIEPQRKADLSELLENIWPHNKRGTDEASAAVTRLQRARFALRPLGLNKQHGLILFKDGLYQLNRKYILLRDIDEFDELLCRIKERPLEDPTALQLCKEALDLYRGPFLEYSKDAPWLTKYRSHYQQELCVLGYTALERMKTLGTEDFLPLLCQRTATIIPHEEAFHRDLIHYLMGRKQGKLMARHLYQLAQIENGAWLDTEGKRDSIEHF